MQMRISGFVSLAICLLISASAHGQRAKGAWGPLSNSEIQALVDEAPSEEDAPDLDILILFDGTYISCSENVPTVRRQRLIKVYTEWAIDYLGDPRIAYRRGTHDLEIHASRTYLLDGSTMDTPENGYNEVSPSALALSADHLDVREMVVTHVGLERGVCVLLDWTVRGTAPHAEIPFSRAIYMHDEFPAMRVEIVGEGDLRGEAVNPQGGLFEIPAPQEGPGLLIWQAESLKARPRHAAQRLRDQVPWVALACGGTWDDLIGGLCRRIAVGASEHSRLDSVLADLEREMPFLGDREFLERATRAICERTNLVRYQSWIFPIAPRLANECILSSTATPIERCALVHAACRTRGLEADIVVPAESRALSLEVPVFEALGDPLLKVGAQDGGTWWIDPTQGTVTVESPIDGGVIYFVASGLSIRREFASVVPNRVELAVFWDLEEGLAQAQGTISGPAAKNLKWQEPDKLVRQWAEGWRDSAEVTELSILASGPDGLTYAVSLKAPLPSPDDRGRTVVDLPLPALRICDLLPQGMDLADSEVDGILFPSAPVRVNLAWSVRAPKDLLHLPGPAIDMAWEDASLTVTGSREGRSIEMEYELSWEGQPLKPNAYSGWRRLLLEATDPRLTRLIFAGKREAE